MNSKCFIVAVQKKKHVSIIAEFIQYVAKCVSASWTGVSFCFGGGGVGVSSRHKILGLVDPLKQKLKTFTIILLILNILPKTMTSYPYRTPQCDQALFSNWRRALDGMEILCDSGI